MKEIKIGDKATLTKKFTSNDIFAFAEVTGDDNPVHIDEDFAQKSIFEQRIAHGFHVGSLISAAIGKHLPGNGTIYLLQSMKFRAPVKIGDEITAIIRVIDFPDKNRVLLKTICINQDGEEVITGEALVVPPSNSILKI